MAKPAETRPVGYTAPPLGATEPGPDDEQARELPSHDARIDAVLLELEREAGAQAAYDALCTAMNEWRGEFLRCAVEAREIPIAQPGSDADLARREMRALGIDPASMRPGQVIRNLRATLAERDGALSAALDLQRELVLERDLLRADAERLAARVKDVEARLDAVRDAVGGARTPGNRLLELANEALAVFGVPAQVAKACEECAEFIAATHHRESGKIDHAQWAERVCGVLITMSQMLVMLGREGDAAMKRQLDKLDAHLAASGKRVA